MISLLGCLIHLASDKAYGAERGERSMIGIDISTAIKDSKAGIILSHSICEKWSVYGKADIRFAAVPLSEDTDSENKMQDMFSAEVAFCCWPVSLFEGPNISFGAYCSEREHPDCSISLGYLCKVWNNIKVGISYNIRLVRSLRFKDTSENGLNLSLCFTF